jgi:hypothetical protein
MADLSMSKLFSFADVGNWNEGPRISRVKWSLNTRITKVERLGSRRVGDGNNSVSVTARGC